MSCLFILYTYLGYPLLIYFLARLAPYHYLRADMRCHVPTASVIIAARNEGGRIGARLQNLVEQDYPAEQLEIIVVSDGSTDDTAEQVEISARTHAAICSIRLICLTEQCGKPTALNHGVQASRGEILIFTDSRQRFAPGAIRSLVGWFGDERVGCVSGELIFVEDTDSTIALEMGTYWNYEKFIRKQESLCGGGVGVTGSVYGLRRKLWPILPSQVLLDDLYVPMSCRKRGFRVLFDSDAIAYDCVSEDIGKEWKRKVRTLAGNWQLFNFFPELRSPLAVVRWWRLFSHKVFRLLVPAFLPVALVSSGLAEGRGYQFLFWLQMLFYFLAVSGFCVSSLRQNKLIGLIYFFIVLNCAAVVGWWQWLHGNLNNCWKES